jgi:hypothetical protein
MMVRQQLEPLAPAAAQIQYGSGLGSGLGLDQTGDIDLLPLLDQLPRSPKRVFELCVESAEGIGRRLRELLHLLFRQRLWKLVADLTEKHGNAVLLQ